MHAQNLENAADAPETQEQYKQQVATMYKDLELSEEKSGDEEAPVPEKRTNAATQDEYAYYLPKLLLHIPDFEASIEDDEDVVRVKSVDPKTGVVSGKNEWSAEERAALRVYVQYLRNNKIPLHFGPLAKYLRKPRKDVKSEYVRAFMSEWTAEERTRLVQLVKAQVKERGGANFALIG